MPKLYIYIVLGRDCGSLWSFERYVDRELVGSVRETARDVSKSECQALCLASQAFPCLSANYDHLLRECALSDANRFTRRPEDLVGRQGVDYLENQCQSGERSSGVP